LFAGYDSKFTCAVWAGFDKPQKIYRGAFGRELAMPVWVDIMNVEAEHSPPQEIKRPAGLKDVEICSRSGLLATDKCYDTVKGPTGDTVRKRTTYMEIATAAQMPTEPCNVHGEPRARIVADTQPAGPEAPRAEPAANVSDVQPIALKGPVLIAQNDPYNSVRAAAKVETVNPDQARNVAGKTDNGESQTERTDTPDPIIENAKREAQKPILRAVPVEPTPEETPVEIRRAVPVGPMDEVDQGALLKAATPSPGESDQ
jgi:membrane peptidoglycan carboxypeptidase